jgi:U3 small nucleolar RNA-associated protein 22
MPSSSDNIPVDFDPASTLVRQLHSSLGSAALFFHDSFGGHVIGVLFKSLPEKKYDSSVGYPVRPSLKSRNKVELSRESLLEGIKRLGGDLIERVEVQRA